MKEEKMQNKIEYIDILFLSDATDKIYKIFKPFLANRYDNIFFEEMIQHKEDFRLYISNDEDRKRVYRLLEELDENMIRYELNIYEPEWDDDMQYSFYSRKEITVDELKKLEINYEEKEPKREDKRFNFDINDFALSFDGKYIATATGRNIFIWCAKTFKCLAHQIAWDGIAEKIYFSSDSKYVIALVNDVGSLQNTIQVWMPLEDTINRWEWIGEDDFNLEYTKYKMEEISPSLSYLCASLEASCYGSDYNFYREFYSLDFTYKVMYHKRNLALYDTSDKLINEIKIPFRLRALSFSHDCQYVCIAQEKNIEIFDTKELNQLKILESHQNNITALATSPCNQYLVSTSLDQTLKLWSLESFELIATIKSGFEAKITAVSFSMDAKQILASSQEGIKIWSVDTKEALFHLFNDEEFWCLLDGDDGVVDKGVLE